MSTMYPRGRNPSGLPSGQGPRQQGYFYSSPTEPRSDTVLPQTPLGRFLYAVNCCRTKRRATICTVLMVTLAAIAVALGLYYAFDKQKPVPTVPNSVNNNNESDNTSQSEDGGVFIPPDTPTMAPIVSAPNYGPPTLPPQPTIPSFPTPPPETSQTPLDDRARLEVILALLRQALQARDQTFPLSEIRTTSDGNGFVNSPQMSALLYLALNDPAPLVDFSRVPRDASATTLQSYFAQTADEQTFRMALTKFGLSLVYFEHNGDGSALYGSWLVDTNICRWEGVVCGIEEEYESSFNSPTSSSFNSPTSSSFNSPTSSSFSPTSSSFSPTSSSFSPTSSTFSPTSSFNSATTRSSVATRNRHRINIQSDPVRMPRGKEITDKPRFLSRNHRRAQSVDSEQDPFVILELNLANTNLTGELSSGLQLFGRNLQVLDVSRNNITGPIPNELWTQQYALQELHLYQNRLNGTISSMVGLASNTLQALYLDSNNLEGNIPPELAKLTNLRRIDLYENQFFGTMPSQIGQLTNLQTIWFSNNTLGGTLPVELCNLTNLENLYLDYNFMFGPIPECFATSYPNAKDIRINHNLFSGTIHTAFGAMQNLRILYLDENEFEGKIPNELGNATRLEHLALGYNRLTGSLPESLSALSNLIVMNISANLYSPGTIPESYVANLVNLQSLSAASANISAIPDLSPWTNLESLDLSDNQLAGNMPIWLTINPATGAPSFPNLQAIDMSHNFLQGPIPDLSNSRNLRVLELQGNSLSQSIPSYITQLLNLETINLRNNFVTGFLPTNLDQLINLKHLDVSGTNQIFGAISQQLCMLNATIVVNCATLQCTCCTCG